MLIERADSTMFPNQVVQVTERVHETSPALYSTAGHSPIVKPCECKPGEGGGTTPTPEVNIDEIVEKVLEKIPFTPTTPPIDEAALVQKVIASLNEQGLLGDDTCDDPIDEEALIEKILSQINTGETVDQTQLIKAVIDQLEAEGLLCKCEPVEKVDETALIQKVIDALLEKGLVGGDDNPVDEEELINKVLEQVRQEYPEGVDEATLITKVIEKLTADGLLGDDTCDDPVDKDALTQEIIDKLTEQGLIGGEAPEPIDEEALIKKIMDAIKADASFGCNCDTDAVVAEAVNQVKNLIKIGYQEMADGDIEYALFRYKSSELKYEGRPITNSPLRDVFALVDNSIEYTNHDFVFHTGKTYIIISSATCTPNTVSAGTKYARGYWVDRNTKKAIIVNELIDGSVLGNDGIGMYLGNTILPVDNASASSNSISDRSTMMPPIVFKPEEDTILDFVFPYTTGTPSILMYSLVYELKQPVVTNINTVDFIHNSQEHPEDTPVGHIMSYMGKDVPAHYLSCDGAIYNIADYPYLSQHILDNFGSVNFFGGDGTETFAVPDLRGEFLRGTGTALRNTGTGLDVGVHQAATEHVNVYGAAGFNAAQGTLKNPDTTNGPVTLYGHGYQSTIEYPIGSYTSRPTNTAVQYCIKFEPTYYCKLGGPEITEEQKEELKQAVLNEIPDTVSVSAEEGNLIEQKEDGLFVGDPTGELSTTVETLSTEVAAQKEKLATIVPYSNYAADESLEHGLFTTDPATTSVTSAMIETIIFPKEIKNHGIEKQGGVFTLHAGKHYRVSIHAAQIKGENSAVITCGVYNATTNYCYISNQTFSFDNIWFISKPVPAMISPTEDTKIKIEVRRASGTGTMEIQSISVSIEEIGRSMVVDPLNYSSGNKSLEDTPVGDIIPYLGNTAPAHYLICDGTEYNIADYPYLANHFQTEFGTINHFGGDGETTFAVPDLRGEFLRGTGKVGAEVGEHQNATIHSNYGTDVGNNGSSLISTNVSLLQNESNVDTVDMKNAVRYVPGQLSSNDPRGYTYTSRPTNTSVLYCIKAEPTYFMHIGDILELSDEKKQEIINETITKLQSDGLVGNTEISISAEANNALVEKEDGFYVPTPAEVSASDVAEQLQADEGFIVNVSTSVSQDVAVTLKQDQTFVEQVTPTVNNEEIVNVLKGDETFVTEVNESVSTVLKNDTTFVSNVNTAVSENVTNNLKTDQTFIQEVRPTVNNTDIVNVLKNDETFVTSVNTHVSETVTNNLKTDQTFVTQVNESVSESVTNVLKEDQTFIENTTAVINKEEISNLIKADKVFIADVNTAVSQSVAIDLKGDEDYIQSVAQQVDSTAVATVLKEDGTFVDLVKPTVTDENVTDAVLQGAMDKLAASITGDNTPCWGQFVVEYDKLNGKYYNNKTWFTYKRQRGQGIELGDIDEPVSSPTAPSTHAKWIRLEPGETYFIHLSMRGKTNWPYLYFGVSYGSISTETASTMLCANNICVSPYGTTTYSTVYTNDTKYPMYINLYIIGYASTYNGNISMTSVANSTVGAIFEQIEIDVIKITNAINITNNFNVTEENYAGILEALKADTEFVQSVTPTVDNAAITAALKEDTAFVESVTPNVSSESVANLLKADEEFKASVTPEVDTSTLAESIATLDTKISTANAAIGSLEKSEENRIWKYDTNAHKVGQWLGGVDLYGITKKIDKTTIEASEAAITFQTSTLASTTGIAFIHEVATIVADTAIYMGNDAPFVDHIELINQRSGKIILNGQGSTKAVTFYITVFFTV